MQDITAVAFGYVDAVGHYLRALPGPAVPRVVLLWPLECGSVLKTSGVYTLSFLLLQLAKQAEAEAVKAAKRFETFHARKLNGSFQEYESVLVMDAATSGTALGLAIAAELDRRKTIAWQVSS